MRRQLAGSDTGGVPMKIVSLDVRDIRFPTSLSLDGSDAMHQSPDYSCAYVVLETDSPDEPDGMRPDVHERPRHRGRRRGGARARAPRRRTHARGHHHGDAPFWRSLTSEDQLRWLGPEKGVIHLATGAIVNAVWDLWAKSEGKPLFRLLADLDPEQLVSRDRLPLHRGRPAARGGARDAAADARRHERAARPTRATRDTRPTRRRPDGSATSDDKIVALVREAVEAGFTHVKMKVGQDLASDARRAALIREAIGPSGVLMMDANQYWGVDEAIAAMRALGRVRPLVDRGADQSR